MNPPPQLFILLRSLSLRLSINKELKASDFLVKIHTNYIAATKMSAVFCLGILGSEHAF